VLTFKHTKNKKVKLDHTFLQNDKKPIQCNSFVSNNYGDSVKIAAKDGDLPLFC
jgi:hypothetical protein